MNYVFLCAFFVAREGLKSHQIIFTIFFKKILLWRNCVILLSELLYYHIFKYAKICVNSPKETQKGVNSLIILTAWVLWKHRNSCVFYGKNPSLIILQREVAEERHLWELAGAKGLRALGESRR
ncbi:hypothetical protein PR202_ga20967 [Eleusine coracana subsp. coracana]|uniref:Uncharacterized protein n=1 Tax=Eleusine coracana subsp. coracana TaxID=191504 RepID=A0AAV5CYG8_ELECO|nr:hypothetical protein PR202_ga20967 [Eleusine coracana subsp. coracana]